MVNQANWQRILDQGIHAIKQQQGEQALALLSAAYRMAPGERDVSYWLGNALRICGQPKEAESRFRELIKQNPHDAESSFALAFLFRAEGRPEHAAELLLLLAKMRSKDLELLLEISGFLRECNQFEAAINVLAMATTLAPQDDSLYFKRAQLLKAVGQFENALDQLRVCLEMNPANGGAWLSLAQLQSFSGSQQEDWQLIEQASTQMMGDEVDMCVAFAFGKALDDVENWASAWTQYTKGNLLRHAMQPWSRTGWNRQVQLSLQNSEIEKPGSVQARRNAVYIVGMLRSGTTLLEQLLDRHSQICGRGELNFLSHMARDPTRISTLSPPELEQLGNELWTQMRLEGPNRHHYIDKNPLNFRFIASLLQVLPEARIIHMTRDGRDSCLSCYFQLFQHPDAGFSYQLDDLVDYYKTYRQIMRRWTDVLGDRMLTVAYENLVRDPENELKRVVDFLGLQWEEDMQLMAEQPRPVRTASTWQARQPIYQRSRARWKNYNALARGFFDAIVE